MGTHALLANPDHRLAFTGSYYCPLVRDKVYFFQKYLNGVTINYMFSLTLLKPKEFKKMILIENCRLSDIPVLHLVKESYKNEKLPLVFFIHGYTSAKEHNLHYGYLLAEAGFRVVLPDALYHGEREVKMSEDELNFKFWDIVTNEIEELEVLKNELITRGIIDPERIGLVGTSMGGITTLGAMTQYSWIKAAVSLMGSPYCVKFLQGQLAELKRLGLSIPLTDEQLNSQFDKLRKYDLSLQPQKLDERPLLFWHGELDEVVPFHYTYEFYNQVKTKYKDKSRINFIVDHNADHKVSREGLLATVEWFKKHL